jgi:hypothetical protein
MRVGSSSELEVVESKASHSFGRRPRLPLSNLSIKHHLPLMSSHVEAMRAGAPDYLLRNDLVRMDATIQGELSGRSFKSVPP